MPSLRNTIVLSILLTAPQCTADELLESGVGEDDACGQPESGSIEAEGHCAFSALQRRGRALQDSSRTDTHSSRHEVHPWMNVRLPLEERVDLLVNQISDDELPLQMANNPFGGVASIPRLGVGSFNYIEEAVHGMILRFSDSPPTTFPQAILTAASFNQSLIHAIGKAIGIEARFFREKGVQWGSTIAPFAGLFFQFNVDIFLDPRWGRGQETPGECPYLNSAYAKAYVTGMQSPHGPRGLPLAAASCKHMTAYAVEGGPTFFNKSTGIRSFVGNYTWRSRHTIKLNVSEFDMAETFLPAFEACAQAGAKGVMCAYHQVNGVPVCADHRILTDILRNKFGFDGIVFTDCDSAADIYYPQRWASTPQAAIDAVVGAGVDVLCSDSFLKNNVDVPKLASLMRISVKRALKTRFELGEFDKPSDMQEEDPRVWPPEWGPSHQQLALEAALQGAVLLKNEGSARLPLQSGVRLAVLGPMRNVTRPLLGDYDSWPLEMISVVEALDPHCNVVLGDEVEFCSPGLSKPISKPDADAVLLVVGLHGVDSSVKDVDLLAAQSQECKQSCLECEGCDRKSIQLPGSQEELIFQASKWGLPVVLVIVSGGAVDLSKIATLPSIRSILWMGYPGQKGPEAIAQLLFGKASPSGRLTHTFYTSEYVSKVDRINTRLSPDETTGHPGRGYRYVDDQWIVYPFGHGLSYDTWQYTLSGASDGQWDSASNPACKLDVSVAVQFDGAWEQSSHTVLLFLRPPKLRGLPLKVLRKFHRVALPRGSKQDELVPSASVVVSFQLERRDFEFADRPGHTSLYSGIWLAELGQPAQLTKKIEVKPSGCVML